MIRKDEWPRILCGLIAVTAQMLFIGYCLSVTFARIPLLALEALGGAPGDYFDSPKPWQEYYIDPFALIRFDAHPYIDTIILLVYIAISYALGSMIGARIFHPRIQKAQTSAEKTEKE